jgi:phosphopantothenoylcysteine decarboxylase/phosphopantothenate--cysteine ligase
MSRLAQRRIHVCVCGGIAAYKAVEIVRALQKEGATVQVALTPNAQAFIAPLTFQAITHLPVLTRTLDASEEHAIGHIEFAQQCDAIVVAPATANLIGKAALGLGDDIVSTVLLAATVPVVVAPAMNTAMYVHRAVQKNIETLRSFGWHLVTPDSGQLACGTVGPGRLPPPEDIVNAVILSLGMSLKRSAKPGPLTGRKVLVSAGPTREHFDPVRYLSNPSTGRAGFAIAEAAAAAGAEVTLVHGPVSLKTPAGVRAVSVVSAADMHAAMEAEYAVADAVVMTAAVSDWRPAEVADHKVKKIGEAESLALVRTVDILAGLGARRRAEGKGPVLVGFAAETRDVLDYAAGKLQSKGVDLIVANDVSAPGSGFGTETNQVWLVEADHVEALPLQSKRAVAERLVSWLITRLTGQVTL